MVNSKMRPDLVKRRKSNMSQDLEIYAITGDATRVEELPAPMETIKVPKEKRVLQYLGEDRQRMKDVSQAVIQNEKRLSDLEEKVHAFLADVREALHA